MSVIEDLSLVELRRDLHQYPESGWKEFRTTALVADELDELGYTLHLGSNAVNRNERLGVPEDDELERARDRARKEGAPEKYLDKMGKVTGLIAEKQFGEEKNPVVGIRVDMDALEITESSAGNHYPATQGFVSHHPNEMHACGHDGHTSIGVGIARRLSNIDSFSGTVKIFFQPAEEGGRGGLPMSETDHLEDLDHFLALHLGLDNETGKIIAGYERPLSNSKFDVEFHGESAHAGKAPNDGSNALQAATTAIQNLYAIPRHQNGATRVNVGQVHSPNVQNAISDYVQMRIEVRGESVELTDYMIDSAKRIIEHSAGMHNVKYETTPYGATTTYKVDKELVSTVVNAAHSLDSIKNIIEREQIPVSEDASYLIKRVQENGGKATYIGVGASNPFGHHTPRFDIDENSLEIGVNVVVKTLDQLSKNYPLT